MVCSVCVCVCMCVCATRVCVWCGVHYTGVYEAQHLTIKLAQAVFARINCRAAVLRNDCHLFIVRSVYIDLLNGDVSPD